MSLDWEQVIVASHDPLTLGRWWCESLGWVVVDDGPVVFEIRPELDRLPGILFVPFEGVKLGKNRLHIDLRPDDQDAEVARLIELGASRVNVEGNEFCVLSARPAST